MVAPQATTEAKTAQRRTASETPAATNTIVVMSTEPGSTSPAI